MKLAMRYAILAALIAGCGAPENFGAHTAFCLDGRTASYSGVDGGARVEVLCTGVDGCAEHDGGRVTCDTSTVSPGDPCSASSSGVAQCWGSTMMLVCDGASFVKQPCPQGCTESDVSVVCANANGCRFTADGGVECLR